VSSVKIDVAEAYEQGRNGLVSLKQIKIWWTEDDAYIDGYGQRMTAINGGFGRIRLEEMDQLCRAYLDARKKEKENDRGEGMRLTNQLLEQLHKRIDEIGANPTYMNINDEEDIVNFAIAFLTAHVYEAFKTTTKRYLESNVEVPKCVEEDSD
jgi:hypothetical protein